jgi:predicted permease
MYGPRRNAGAGFTVANFSVIGMLKRPKVYVASVLRLTLIPAALIAATYAAKELLGAALGLYIEHNALYLLLFATATPLGLNTVVFPESYGGDPEIGASMTMISHTLCIVSIPLMYALMTLIFGPAMF